MTNEQIYREIVKSMRKRKDNLAHDGTYWTQEENEHLAEWFAEGIGITKISCMLQRTECAVQQQIEKLDLYGRKENPLRCPRTPKPSQRGCEFYDHGKCLRPDLADGNSCEEEA